MVSAIKNFWSEKETGIAWKVSVFAVILVRIFPLFGRSRISLYSVRMRENADQNNSEYGHFSRSGEQIPIYVTEFFQSI